MIASHRVFLLLLPLALLACGDSDDSGDSLLDAGDTDVLCVARGSHLTSEGCLEAERGFAEKFVAREDCLSTTQTLCLQARPDSGLSGAWIFSGEYFADISSTEPCDAETLTLAESALACDASACTPCEPDAGTLCGLASNCD
jgi:hypothetical protein